MKLVIFGLSMSSSWGNGHATLWRGLCSSLDRLGHTVVFFEKDVAYYAQHRDSTTPAGVELVLYPTWDEVRARARREIERADVGMVTSYCPDALSAAELILTSRILIKCFYDLDTPITLDRLQSEGRVDYVGDAGLKAFDLVLSYTGGSALSSLRDYLGARRVVPLYGSVDPEAHRPVPPDARFWAHASYLGTFAPDRQEALDKFFFQPARDLADRTFVLGGAQYPKEVCRPSNVRWIEHIAPPDHAAFYCSAPITVSVTRAPMAQRGYCPSGRLFEAAACGVPVLSDRWEGLDDFFEPDREIFVCDTSEEALDVIRRSPEDLRAVGQAARDRALSQHTAETRARELIEILRA